MEDPIDELQLEAALPASDTQDTQDTVEESHDEGTPKRRSRNDCLTKIRDQYAFTMTWEDIFV